MEKLIELLDIYLKDKREYSTYDFDIIKIRHYCKISGLYEHLDEVESQALIISKEFGFIKWLVDNDKIDIKKAKEGEIMLSRNDEENIIGKLSISDTPIDLLCSLLK